MPFNSIVGQYLKNCVNGQFDFLQTDSLAKKNAFPDDYGVYLIQDAISKQFLYVGKSGTIYNNYNCDSGFGNKSIFDLPNQTLRARIQAKHSKSETREQFYKRIMNRDKIAKLIFIYFITMTKASHQGIKYPFEAEAELLSAFIRQFGNLPEWNKSA